MEPSEKILTILSNRFEIDLYKASIASLNDSFNKLRYNNFAYSLRELSRHFLRSLSPDDHVKACSWFKQELEDGKVTRGQRIKYAIQGGISDELLSTFGLDSDEVNAVNKSIRTSIDSLSKYTHINPEVFGLGDEEIERRSEEVKRKFESFVETIESNRKRIIDMLGGRLEDQIIRETVTSFFENIDALAPHHSLDEVEVEDYFVHEVNHEEIVVQVSGSVHVTLMYGSSQERREGDGLNIEDSFPFKTFVRYSIDEDFPEGIYDIDDFGVDTSSWDIDPTDEDY